MECCKVGIDVIDEAVVDLHWNIVCIERALKRRLVLPGLHVENIFVHLCRELCAIRPGVMVHRSEIRRKHFFPVVAICGCPVKTQPRLVKLHFISITQNQFRIGKLGIRKNIENAFRGVGHQAGVGNNFFSLPHSLCVLVVSEYRRGNDGTLPVSSPA